MTKDKCHILGKFIKTHGKNGALILKYELDLSKQFFNETELFFVDFDNGLVPFFISTGSVRERDNSSVVLKLDDITDEITARELVSLNVYLPKADYDIIDQEFEPVSFVGFIIEDAENNKIGTVDNVLKYTNNPLFVINTENKEILFPANEDFIISIDTNLKILRVDVPDGLLDL